MIAFTCSGTGGHIYPAIAVAQQLDDTPCLFIVEKDRLAADVVPKYGFQCEYIICHTKQVLSWFNTMATVFKVFKNNPITSLISTGGYATIPVVFVAWLLRIPVTLLEQNTIPGRANRLLAFFASKICVSFQSSTSYFKHKHIYVTGNPIRSSYPEDEHTTQLVEASWRKGKHLLVFGGSQGAHALNDACIRLKSFFKQHHINVIHITGSSYFSTRYSTTTPQFEVDDDGAVIYATVGYVEQMNILYNWADVVLSRSGATSVAELLHYQKPALLVPYPHATDNHQYYNAMELVQHDIAKICTIDDLTDDTFTLFFDKTFVFPSPQRFEDVAVFLP